MDFSHDRLFQIGDHVMRVASFRCQLQEVEEISGYELQAVADVSSNTVIVTTGLIEVLTDDELAWILAHEIVHLRLQHARWQRSMEDEFGHRMKEKISQLDKRFRSKGTQNIIRKSAVLAARVAAFGARMLAASAFSYKAEKIADAHALKIMTRAGYDPSAAITALEKLYEAYQRGSSAAMTIIDFLFEKHPIPSVRIHLLRKEIEKLESGGAG